ncbi:unnamed protein product [Adineta ricciae]|uniref:EF-hand domain-containing protein n=1 Tax=Adineta ricciae TaxID=249248 RepID=A0A815F673_ADIRI|nr:unnamed protein product [Adineta ricciae]
MNNFNEKSNEQSSARKPSWQIARDISTAMLWRKSSKLSLKPGIFTRLKPSSACSISSDSISKRSTPKKRTIHSSEARSKPSQPQRIPRMPSEKEAALIDIAYTLSCAFCNETCVSNYLRCRICMDIFHVECLSQRGYLHNQSISFRNRLQPDWSCPDCRDLTRLLNHDELLYLIHAFDQLDKNRDGYIILEEFLSFQSNKSIPEGLELFVQHNHETGRRYFALMDCGQRGVVAWSDFVLLYACKLICAKDKIELTTKLTEKELVHARKLFLKDPKKSFDNDFNRMVTREHLNQIHHDLMLSLNKKYSIEFIDTVLTFDNRIDNTAEKSSAVHWSEFLREIALLILLDRSNDDVRSSETRRGSIPAQLSNAVKVTYPKLHPNERDSTSRLSLSRSNTLATPKSSHASYDKGFLKHAKLLQKLNERNQVEELKRKQLGSSIDFTIVEDGADAKDLKLPKLKPNARDDRRTITDPWTCVNEMQRLRNEPIPVRWRRIS